MTQRDIPTACAFIDQLLSAFEILPVDDALLRAACALPGSDFEDNV